MSDSFQGFLQAVSELDLWPGKKEDAPFYLNLNERGIDDSGYVANYVESETIVIEGENILAHLQIRGSVPSFWEQPGINFGQHKCNIVRSLEGSYPAAFKHFSRILGSFSVCRIGKIILHHFMPNILRQVNLLGKGEGEDKVSSAFAEVITKAQNQVNISIEAAIKRSV